jgi:hypothetical protein
LDQKSSQIKALALPILPHGSEIWIVRQRDEKRMISIEKKSFRRTAGCTVLDHKINKEILEEMKVGPINEK